MLESETGNDQSETGNDQSETGNAICLLCKKEFSMITAGHLKKAHSLSMEGYKMRFPGVKVTGDKFKIKQRQRKKIIKEDKESNSIDQNNEDQIIQIAQKKIKELIPEEINQKDNAYIGFRNNESSKIVDDKYIISDTINNNEDLDIPDTINNNEDFLEIPELTVDKDLIIKILIKNGFENIRDNHLISKKSLSGHLEYEFITDICDIFKKVDLRFKNVFWHNEDKFLNTRRNKLLKDDGWKIIEIESNPILISELLDKINS